MWILLRTVLSSDSQLMGDSEEQEDVVQREDEPVDVDSMKILRPQYYYIGPKQAE